MENRKNLQVNCAICDVRNITEELLSAYETVRINAATLFTNPASRELLGRYGVSVNAAMNVSVEGAVRFSAINGPMTLGAGSAVAEDQLYVMVNGPLTVEPGAEEVLKSYAGMIINGPVVCPESMLGLLSAFQINGPVRAYPDGCILLKRVAVLDRFFHLRAKQDARYCAFSRIVALASDIDFAQMAQKNVRFVTDVLLVTESLAEAAVPLFDEKTDIRILPDGCSYVDGSAELNETLLKRHGGKLYIDGDLSITPDSAAVLDQVSFLHVGGELRVCRSLRDQVLAMDLSYDALRVVGGRVISGRPQVEIDAAMLENAERGVSVMDCASVAIAADVAPELLREKLVSLSDCAVVNCASREQQSVLQMLADGEMVIAIMTEKNDEEEEPEPEDDNTVRINAASYIF